MASSPSVIDLACGLQPACASGTRSSTVRVTAASWSNSGSSAWAIDIDIPVG